MADLTESHCAGPMQVFRVRLTFPVEFERDVRVCAVHAAAWRRDALAKGVLL